MIIFSDGPISGDDILHKLIPNWVSFTVQILAFVIMVIVIIILAYKPVKKIINKRKDYIDENIKQSEIARKRAEQNLLKSDQMIIDSEKKANETIAQAKLEALKQKEELIYETNNIISQMKDDAAKEIEQSKIDAKEEIRKEMVSLALDASSEILGRNVTNKDNEKLAKDFIRSVDKK